jgi:hypothetical protein
MKNITLAATAVVALLLLLTVGAPTASADVFNLTSCHLSGGCGTATNFGTVTVAQNTTTSTSVDFSIVLTSGNFFVETGAGGDNWFDFNDALFGSSVINISATVNGTPVSVLGGLTGVTNRSPLFMADGTGNFSAGISCSTASSCNGASGVSLTNGTLAQINDLHFTVTNATVAALETLSAGANGGQMFVADIYLGQTGGPSGCSGGGGGSACTGPVDSSPGSVPDGGMTLMLLGGALFGLETLRRKIRA